MAAGTIIEYVREFGDKTLQEFPFNDVDSLVLCQLSYLKFDGVVPEVREKKPGVTLKDIYRHADYEKLYADERYEKDNRALFEAALHSTRYRKLKLNCYINIVEKEWETQFSAVTFLMDGGILYLAYRGTDETIVGWKEDFNMAFLDPVPGQAYSVKYLNMVTGKLWNKFYVGGHSKGGNLAVYAAMKCPDQVRKRILKVYSMDGPGFRPEVLASCQYDRIADRVVKILPHSSLVGMIFEKDIRYRTIESKTFGLAQHNPFTWIVKDGQFVDADDIYERRLRMDETLNEWILSLEQEQLKTFVDTLYQVISASEADNLIDFTADWKKSMTGIVNALKEVDEETTKMIKEVIRSLFELAKDKMQKEWKRGSGVKRKLAIKRKSTKEAESRLFRIASGPAAQDATAGQ